MSLHEEALKYHSQGKPGKIEVVPTKPLLTQHDLTMAYTPGVAEPVLEIDKNPDGQEDALGLYCISSIRAARISMPV